jgi:hypothetical protein
LDAAGVPAIGSSEVGNVSGKATATAEAAMAGEGDKQINRVVGARIAEVMKDTSAQGIATGAVVTAWANARWPVTSASLDRRFGEVLDTGDALGDIGYIRAWTSHRMNS